MGNFGLPAHLRKRIELLFLFVDCQMVHISTVRESNAQGKSIEGLVAVFIGGTGGIGECTAKELFLQTIRPKAYIVGR